MFQRYGILFILLCSFISVSGCGGHSDGVIEAPDDEKAQLVQETEQRIKQNKGKDYSQ